MQVTEILSEGLKREYRIVVPAADIRSRIDEKLDEISETANINGFRRGKVPRSLLRRRFEKSVLGDVLKEAIDRSSTQAMLDRGVKPALTPQVDIARFEPGDDLEFTVALELLPEFDPGDVKALKITRLTAEVSDAAVEKAVAGLAEREKSFVAAAEGHEAEDGDSVRIDFDGRIDGEAFERGTAKDFDLELGSGSFVPGFEDGLVGAKKGESRDVQATFPETYVDQRLAGKTAVFAVTVTDVRVAEAVAVDDDLAARFGMADLAALRAAVRERAQGDYRAASRMKLKREILDMLADTHDFPVPTGMVDREFDAIWQQIEQDLKRAGTTWDETEEDEDSAREEYRGIAERRVRLGLVLSEIGRRNNVNVPQDELNRAVMNRARMFPGEEQKVFDLFRSNPEMMNELHAPLFEDKVIDFIIEMADVTDRAVSEEELFADSHEAAGGNDARSD